MTSASHQHHVGRLVERLGAITLHFHGSGENAPDGVQLTGGEPEEVARLRRYGLLIVDEVGYIPFDGVEMASVAVPGTSRVEAYPDPDPGTGRATWGGEHMKLLRGLLGGLLWILAGVVGLLGVVLSVTLILLPLGLPLLALSRRMFGQSMRLVLPRQVTHPADELNKSARKRKDKAASAAPEVDTKRARKKAKKAKKKAGKLLAKQRERVS